MMSSEGDVPYGYHSTQSEMLDKHEERRPSTSKSYHGEKPTRARFSNEDQYTGQGTKQAKPDDQRYSSGSGLQEYWENEKTTDPGFYMNTEYSTTTFTAPKVSYLGNQTLTTYQQDYQHEREYTKTWYPDPAQNALKQPEYGGQMFSMQTKEAKAGLDETNSVSGFPQGGKESKAEYLYPPTHTGNVGFYQPEIHNSDRFQSAAKDRNGEILFKETKISEGLKFKVYKDGSPVPFMMALDHLEKQEPKFVKEFLKVLKKVKYDAYFFETPQMSLSMAYKSQFEFVLIDASQNFAGVRPFPDPFYDHIAQTETGVAAFPSLGGDAILVAPAIPQERSMIKNYTHLASFVKYESETKVKDFWKRVGKEMRERLFDQREKSVWMSTNGTGVHWLHVRLDSIPKYYVHHPYRYN